MSDLISRKAASNAVRNLGEDHVARLKILLLIEELPPAEPERKKGHWQRRKGSDCWECSQCHAVLENDDLRMHNFYFCYHCGANMMNKSGYIDIEEVAFE